MRAPPLPAVASRPGSKTTRLVVEVLKDTKWVRRARLAFGESCACPTVAFGATATPCAPRGMDPPRPVVWELDDRPLTWKGQLSGQDVSTFLDPSTGGQQLQIFKSAIYKCFVQQEFIARFNAQGNQDALGALQDKIKAEEALQGQPGPTLRRLALTLLVGTVLAAATLLLLLLRLLRASRGKRSRQTLLVK